MDKHLMGNATEHLVPCIDCLSYSKLIGEKSPGGTMFQALTVKVAKLESTDGRDSCPTLSGNNAAFGGGFRWRRTVWFEKP